MLPRVLLSATPALFHTFFPPKQRARLNRICRWQLDTSRNDAPAFRGKLKSAEALITTWDSPCFGEDLLRCAPELRLVAHCGGEVKSRFPLQAFEKLTITNAAAPMARATAELGAAFLLYGARNVDRYREALRSSNRIYVDVHEGGAPEFLYGAEVAMMGFGAVGRALVDLMRGFALQWKVYDPYAEFCDSDGITEFRNLKKLLRRAHVLVLTAALTEQTRGLLNRENLALLPDGALIINVARGGLVDLGALLREIRRKRLRYAVDVTEPEEPLPIRHPLRSLPGVLLTPHIGGAGRNVRPEMAEIVMDNLENFFSGRPVQNQVTKPMLEKMT